MKKLIIILIIIIGLTSCNSTNNETEFESTGKILGQDLTLCVCWCGGYIIEIDGETQTYRFSDEFPDFIDTSLENLPIDIKFNWELTECNQITITEIEEI